MILRRQGLCLSSLAWLAACAIVAPATRAQRSASAIELPAPIAVYLHEPASDVFPAAPPFGEVNALHDLDQLVRLKKSGMRVDYDLLDASAIAPDGLHPIGHTAAWPNGPEIWIARCRAAGIRPGLRFYPSALHPDSHAPDLSKGLFPPEFISALQSWYDRGIRLFVFGSLDSDAALAAFHAQNRDAVLLAIEKGSSVSDAFPAFQLIAAGPPRGPSWPETSVERADEIESDSEIRRVEQTGVPLAHTLSESFIAAPACLEDSCASDSRPALACPWKGDFLLSEARGGWVHPLIGDLDSIQAGDARWMARAQRLFFELESHGRISSFGGAPWSGLPYGFAGGNSRGAVYFVVNPGQAVARLSLPALASGQPGGTGRILFRDAGFSPHLADNAITLGPGQMAAVGFGAYSAQEFNFGVQQEVVIPTAIEPIDADFHLTAPGVLEARFDPPIRGVLRVIVSESASSGDPPKVDPHASGNHHLTLEINQGGRPIPLRPEGTGSDGESILNAGLSWAIAEIDVNDLTPGVPVHVLFRSDEKSAMTLDGTAYQVIY